MSRPVPDLDDDLLELPPGGALDDEAVGVEDAEELLFQELEGGPEEIGLDTEGMAALDAFGSLTLAADDEADEGDPLDNSTFAIETDIEGDGAEHGWLEESDATGNEEWDDALPEELGDESGDDGGEEGVDDPLLDGLPDDPQRTRKLDEDDDAEGFEDDGLDELAREIGSDA